jgi:predicted DNA-binding protein (MmcQ/YjbR family)
MNSEDIREFCLSLKGTTESFPFDETTLVFKVFNKMYCLLNLEGDLSVNLKNDPERIIEMREEFPSVLPGYHMNKKYWNTVLVDGSIPGNTIKKWIAESYGEIVKNLPVMKQQHLKIKLL